MKKTILTMLCGMLFSLTTQAQTQTWNSETPFAKNKYYVGASLSTAGLTYSKDENWNASLHVKGGYLFEDDWMITANVGCDYHRLDSNSLTAGAGLRYYIVQNGLYLGAGANYVHRNGFDDLMPTVQLGYAFFLNRTVTVEPEVYYNQSLKNHDLYSGFGIRVGIGIYFE